MPSSGQNLNCTWAGIIHYGLSCISKMRVQNKYKRTVVLFFVLSFTNPSDNDYYCTQSESMQLIMWLVNLFGIGGSIFTFGWITCPEWTAYYSVTDANICIVLLELDIKHHVVSKTVWIMSVSRTELIWQVKTWETSNQEVGNLRFVVFQLSPHWRYRVILVMFHFPRLPLDANSI